MSMRIATVAARWLNACAALALVLLPICAESAHAAGMMRVEVEVYKGPVGQSLEIQIGQEAALLAGAVTTLSGLEHSANQYLGTIKSDCNSETSGEAVDKNSRLNCAYLNAAIEAATDAQAQICRINEFQFYKLREVKADSAEKQKYFTELFKKYSQLMQSVNMPTSEIINEVLADKTDAAGQSVRTAMISAFEKLSSDGIPVIMQACANATQNRMLLESGQAVVSPEAVPQAFLQAGATENLRPQAVISNLTREIATVAALMQVKAYSITNSLVGFVPSDQRVRNLAMAIAYTLAEYSNQIAARNHVLSKFCGVAAGNECATSAQMARKFPTGDFLRDSGATEFIDVFDWFNASLPGYHGALRQVDRSRAIKLLTDDFYWEKVNQVYASGTGEVAMAFIKDDIGNWDLKSFSNDPTKLLAAYSQAARALIGSAIKVATTVGPGGAAAAGAAGVGAGQRLLSLASSVVSGDGIGAPSLGGLDLAALRARTRQRLDTAKQMFTDRKAALAAKVTEQTGEVGKAQAALDKAGTARTKAEGDIASARDMRAQCGSDNHPCADADRALQAAYTAKDNADGEHAAVSSALAEVKARQAKLVAAQDVLGETAADSFERILDDYNQDLLVLQQVAAKGASEETAKP